MSAAEAFFDTNVVLYLLSGDTAKADRAEELLAMGGAISSQVLNEFASVARRKLGMAWDDIREVLAQVRVVCAVEAVTAENGRAPWLGVLRCLDRGSGTAGRMLDAVFRGHAGWSNRRPSTDDT
jgi:predicted nucleic acid-binding protein